MRKDYIGRLGNRLQTLALLEEEGSGTDSFDSPDVKNKNKLSPQKQSINLSNEEEKENEEGGGPETKQKPLKQKICLRFVKMGSCEQGSKCEFAHSVREIKNYSPVTWKAWVHSMKPVHRSEMVGRYTGSIDKQGRTSLMESCISDNPDGVEELIFNGANIIQLDFKGFDALYHAVSNSSLSALRALLVHGGAQVIKDRVYGEKKRPIMCVAAISGSQSVIELLYKQNFDLNAIDIEL